LGEHKPIAILKDIHSPETKRLIHLTIKKSQGIDMNFKSVFSFKKSNQSLPFLPQSKAGAGLDKSKQKL
jgi:hypothetical protein